MPASIKLSNALKARVKRAAAREAISAHAFMLAAIETETSRAERRAAFLDEAREAEAEAIATDTWYAAEDVLEYALEVAKGRKAQVPGPTRRRR